MKDLEEKVKSGKHTAVVGFSTFYHGFLFGSATDIFLPGKNDPAQGRIIFSAFLWGGGYGLRAHYSIDKKPHPWEHTFAFSAGIVAGKVLVQLSKQYIQLHD